MSVVADMDLSGQLIAFGATAFVSDLFVTGVLNEPAPHLAVQILDREYAGRKRVVLRPCEIRKRSAGEGLNLVILHYSEVVEAYSAEEQYIIRDMMVRSLLEIHSRYNLRALIYEFFGEEDLSFVTASGALLVSDFRHWYERQGISVPPSRRRPFLVAIDRATAHASRAAWLSWLFFSHAARVGLSPSEQRIAARALAGETDADLAHNPEVSAATVRRHWRSIYKKFIKAGIELLSERFGQNADEASLQKKKRPFLLNYLRQHAEELRPQGRRRRTGGQPNLIADPEHPDQRQLGSHRPTLSREVPGSNRRSR
jgi:hypothetical protein